MAPLHQRKVSVRAAQVLAVLAMLVGSTLLLPGRAYAASCSDASCAGLDPVATGCSADAYTATSAQLYRWSDGANVGKVELRYSPTCGTNWTKVTSYIGSINIYAEVAYSSSWGSGSSYYLNSSSVYTDMTATRTAQACGRGYLSSTGYTNFPTICA